MALPTRVPPVHAGAWKGMQAESQPEEAVGSKKRYSSFVIGHRSSVIDQQVTGPQVTGPQVTGPQVKQLSGYQIKNSTPRQLVNY
jgi:hypothetical protein